MPLVTTILISPIESNIPFSLTTILETEKISTSLTSILDSNLISTSIQTSINNIQNENEGFEEEKEKTEEIQNINETNKYEEDHNFDIDIEKLDKYQLVEQMDKIIESIEIRKNYEITGQDFK